MRAGFACEWSTSVTSDARHDRDLRSQAKPARTSCAVLKLNLPHVDDSAVGPEGTAIAACGAVIEAHSIHPNGGPEGANSPAREVEYVERSTIELAAAGLKSYLAQAPIRRVETCLQQAAGLLIGLIRVRACICQNEIRSRCRNGIASDRVEGSCPILTAPDEGNVT